MAADTERPELADLVAVRACAGRRQADTYALVLSAMGISCWIKPVNGMFKLYVDPADAIMSAYQLTTYDRENRYRKPTILLRSALPTLETAMVYWVVLLFFFAAGRQHTFAIDWISAGSANTELMRSGQWWRAVTALCLHHDPLHLISNLVFGTIFLMFLAQIVGTGVAWLTFVLAGAAGNILNALVQPPAHTSIGASTAIFAAIGLMAAVHSLWGSKHPTFSARKWVPVAAGAALLAMFGLSGERTDILAHVLGFVSGVGAGWLLTSVGVQPRDLESRSTQRICSMTAAAIILFTWSVAVI